MSSAELWKRRDLDLTAPNAEACSSCGQRFHGERCPACGTVVKAAEEELRDLAEVRVAKGVPRAQAMDEVIRERPDLYRRHAAEVVKAKASAREQVTAKAEPTPPRMSPATAALMAMIEAAEAEAVKSGERLTRPEVMDRVIKANPDKYAAHVASLGGDHS